MYNNAPVVYHATYTVLHDTTLSGEVYGYDQDGDPITAHLVNGPTNGTVTLDPDGTFVYTPNAGYVGSDRFTLIWTDGLSSSTVSTVGLELYNTGPVATGEVVELPVGEARTWLVANLLENDYDPDGDTLGIEAVDFGVMTANSWGVLLSPWKSVLMAI